MALDNAILEWNQNPEPDVAGYRVYATVFPPFYAPMTVVSSPTATTVTINAPAFSTDGVWSFKLSAFDTSGNESALTSADQKRIVRTQTKFVTVR